METCALEQAGTNHVRVIHTFDENVIEGLINDIIKKEEEQGASLESIVFAPGASVYNRTCVLIFWKPTPKEVSQ